MINIAERPPEVEDRAVPGHWEGDLIIGKQNQTAIGTLVERQTGYTKLLHLPDGYKPEQVRDVLAAKINTLPDSLRLSLTWDQGPPMREADMSASTPASTSTSATRTRRGSAAPMKTREPTLIRPWRRARAVGWARRRYARLGDRPSGRPTRLAWRRARLSATERSASAAGESGW